MSTESVGLAVSSSTGVMSIAVGSLGGGHPVVSATIETDRRHAEEISPLIATLTTKAGTPLSDLDVLVVDRGPGRFTGLRVGLATVRTLAFALDLDVIGLTSLEILANATGLVDHEEYHRCGQTVTAVIDARRNEVFQQVFTAGRPVAEPAVGLAEDLARAASGIVVGDGLDRYPDAYGAAGAATNRRFPLTGVTVDAVTMLAIAAGRDPQPGSRVEPLYLRNPDVNPNVTTRPRA
ncbi:MAG: tRNA (adenosine(37)-N6)-threonylcarbamoyltransferase complex dimerization subunit type 1 TsaB [Acidimicrobiia bacterium]|nr:tRNA (adenosine(37)-N6)-threonylcarbamoyltransferase complex dimerization subunit type 1 TsaB [Acidimicrobiia bacterium]